MFLKETHRYITDMRTSLDAQDFRSLARTAHTIRGAAPVFGGAALGEACHKLEETCQLAAPGDVAPVIENVRQLFTNLAHSLGVNPETGL